VHTGAAGIANTDVINVVVIDQKVDNTLL